MPITKGSIRLVTGTAGTIALAWAGAADASGLRITVGSGHRQQHSPFIVKDRGGLEVFRERRVTVQANPNCYNHLGQYVCGGRPPGATGAPNCYDHQGRYVCGGASPDRQLHHRRPVIAPQPVFIVPSRNCFVPGYWHTHWLPQHTLYNVWVPGQWAAGGSWVDGHYEQRPYVSGYVPQYTWVPERWNC